ncbi:MAG TPA: MFS transporter [Candidatus Limnocylindrales bacterium]|nr:MFS transporter [Candidatus Limnocylindrales bacterium]
MTNPSRSPRLRSADSPALLALAAAGLFVAALDAYVVVAALLPMLTAAQVPVNHLERATPVVTGFLLGYLAVMPIAGPLSDRFGRLRVFAIFLVAFALGSLVTATASSLSQIVAGRVLQGAGGGALVPVVLALVADLYTGRSRATALGAVSGLQEVGSVLGPLWGGVLAATSQGGWRWIFWINVLFAGGLLWALWPGIRQRPVGVTAAPLDGIGALLAALALALLTLALYAQDPEHSPVGSGFWWQAPAAVVLLILFVWRERRAPAPLIDVRHFRDTGFTGAALVNGLAGAGLMVALVFIPVLAESPVFSMNPRQAALLLLRLMLGIPVGALLGGLVAGRLRSNRGIAAIGMLIAAFAFAMLAGWGQDALRPHFLGTPLRIADVELFAAGLGLGLEIAPVSAALLDLVSEAERGAGAAFLIVMRLCGMLVGFSAVAGFGLYHFNRVTAQLTPPLFSLRPDYGLRLAQYELQLRQAIFDEYHTIFTIAAALVLCGALIAAATLRPPRSSL